MFFFSSSKYTMHEIPYFSYNFTKAYMKMDTGILKPFSPHSWSICWHLIMAKCLYELKDSIRPNAMCHDQNLLSALSMNRLYTDLSLELLWAWHINPLSCHIHSATLTCCNWWKQVVITYKCWLRNGDDFATLSMSKLVPTASATLLRASLN